MSSHDPRSSSTQSLVPEPMLADAGRRRLLLVYLHGFMGDETSFRSFPAHVHNLVTVTLAQSHVVHSKIYPRYKSRDSLQVARDNFSTWLAPHEDQWTDAILLGHSMGGLLAADIALAFRHRIIGIVNFDVPFLGMHPGIVKAGLGSIFNTPPPPQDAIAADTDPEQKLTRTSTLFNPKPADPNYNPMFPNDVRLPNRSGWENSLHWLTKHYKDGLAEATRGLVKSHMEFGGAMADYRGLKDRYAKIRALEEDDEAKRKGGNPQLCTVPRIRFINYYTVSTGRPKKPTSPPLKSPSPSCSPSCPHQDPGGEMNAPGDMVESVDHHLQQQQNNRSLSVVSSELELTHIQPDPIPSSPPPCIQVDHHDQGSEPAYSDDQLNTVISAEANNGPPNLPEIPPIPQEPPFVDLLQYTDKAQRKAAEKEHDQALKEYQKAVKARNKMINERTKLEEKWEKERAREAKEREKAEKKRADERQKEEKRREQEQDRERKEHEKDQQNRLEETTHMSAEERQREIERGQRRAEAEQREREARQRQREADVRQGKITAEEEPQPVPTVAGLDQGIGTMHLGHHETASQGPRGPYGHYEFSRSGIMNQPPPESRADSTYTLSTTDSRSSHTPEADATGNTLVKPKKLKKFCMLPPKDASGNRDPTWIEVFMDNMDEVTAHTSLFFVNETYERLVGDVGARIEDWVNEVDTMRLIQDLERVKS
ncbi:uncharacterized protein SETTUDRAFT_145536 [Exserohilum turcica Et28A]|uniref:AB hydrolase-1 domain-containing protein n=1 Tax=Exserohilum turcicum (strain 28A) TaxID=671987 RepID=R0IZU2_EXST2|nr:uncharacterized protein SETTUDRAFT_145536 [Exserohilum turcica Et28A]EOA90051.1 hypothetical protein SETTUDRAFT_145536 [Exserohilum turcica Et28A]